MTPEEINAQALAASITCYSNRYNGVIDLGDKVKITLRMVGILYPHPSHDSNVEGFIGIVHAIHARRGVSGLTRAAAYYVRMLEGPRSGTTVICEGDSGHEAMELHAKGDGQCTPGVHFPFTEDELREQRYEALVAKVAAFDIRHQGFSNPATFIAATHLEQDPRFHARLPSLRRKDGTVNADKIRSAFLGLKHQVDSWAFACPFDVPAEFAHHHIRGLEPRMRINWHEVAAHFAMSPEQPGMKDRKKPVAQAS